MQKYSPIGHPCLQYHITDGKLLIQRRILVLDVNIVEYALDGVQLIVEYAL